MFALDTTARFQNKFSLDISRDILTEQNLALALVVLTKRRQKKILPVRNSQINNI
jgi:hypothetical protein